MKRPKFGCGLARARAYRVLMDQALLWGSVAAAPLLLGALLALWRGWPPKLLGLVLGFGAGALMASIAFELVEAGLQVGGPISLVVGVAAGALTYYLADRLVDGHGRAGRAGSGPALAVGALLDGVPEQFVLGIGIANGEGVGLALVVAIFVSNLPESIGSASDLLQDGRKKAQVLWLWAVVAVICALATVAGYAVADAVTPPLRAASMGFAAGALLVMLVDAMVPEARSKGGQATGLLTVFGFAVAAGLAIAV